MKKMNSTLLFSVKEQRLETRKLIKLLAKEEAKSIAQFSSLHACPAGLYHSVATDVVGTMYPRQ